MPYIGYAIILTICLIVILVTFGKIRERWNPYLLYSIGASMVLMTTLAGPYLVGLDIHLEYYYARLHSGQAVPDPIVHIPQAASIANTIIAPMLPIPLLWVYKLVFPLLFAAVPVILYFIFRRWFTPTQSFLASFLFIAFPAFSMEIPAIARQMVVEFVLVLLLYLLIVSQLHSRYKMPLIVICSALIPLIHYSIGMLVPVLLVAGLYFGWKFKLKEIWRPIGIALAVVILTSMIYFPLAEKGAIVKVVAHRYNSMVPAALEVPIELPPDPRPPQFKPLRYRPAQYQPPPVPGGVSFIDRYTPLVRSGLGTDFLDTTTTGKVFRMLQWAIFILIAVGLWKLRKHREYIFFAGGGALLLILMVVPGFSGMLNITRMVHLSLFLLAPALVFALKPKYVLAVLIPYFLFTSGFVFEIIKHPNVERITIPYSIGLSDYRIDLGAAYTEDDLKVRDYIVENCLFPLYSDLFSSHLMGETLGYRSDLQMALKQMWIPSEGYIFARSRNVQDGTFVLWNGTGLRIVMDPARYEVDFNKNIVFQSGDARVLEVR